MSEVKDEQETTLRDIPSLATILGLVEGQLVLLDYVDDNQQCVIAKLYDDVLFFRRRNGRIMQCRLNRIEELIHSGSLILLTKNKKPVMGRRQFYFFGKWMPKENCF